VLRKTYQTENGVVVSGIFGWHIVLVIGVILMFVVIAAALAALVIWLARRLR